MCEKKRTLKERLLAIMQHSRKPRFVIGISLLLLAALVGGAILLGAGTGRSSQVPPRIYIGSEFEKTREAIMGGYKWKYHGQFIIADASHPQVFDYKDENIINASGSEQLIISTQKTKMDQKYNFKLEKLSIYKNNDLMKFDAAASYKNHSLYLQTPLETGDYIYCLTLKYDQGTVDYGFVVRVPDYHLARIAQFQTPYIGNHVKVLALAGLMPAPDPCFIQQYISMVTDQRPYKLTVFYETKANDSYPGAWPIVNNGSAVYLNLQKNALVLFCMIDNLDELTFALRNSQSDGNLDVPKYDTSFTFKRDFFEEKYGNLIRLRNNPDELQSILTAMPTRN